MKGSSKAQDLGMPMDEIIDQEGQSCGDIENL